MKKALQYLVVILLAISLTTLGFGYGCCDTCYSCCYDNCSCLDPCHGSPFLQIRSQGRDSARELVGWQQFINRCCMDSKYTVFSVAVEYSRSFNNERLAHYLFGNDLIHDCCALLIQSNAPYDGTAQ